MGNKGAKLKSKELKSLVEKTKCALLALVYGLVRAYRRFPPLRSPTH